VDAIVAELRVTQAGNRVIVIKALLRFGRRLDMPFEQRPVEGARNLECQLCLAGARLTFNKNRPLESNRCVDGHHEVVGRDVALGTLEFPVCHLSQYYRSTRGNLAAASRLLADRINAALRDEFGKRTVQEVVSGERTAIMQTIAKEGDELASDLGVEIVDVRVKRIDFPEDISESIYERMRTERQRVAAELRAQGAEAAERIQADADRQRIEIAAQAYREAELLRGEGDAKAAEVYAGAFEQNAEFYSFWRSLGAYRDVFEGGGSVMVLDPDSEFFRYFGNRQGPVQ